MTARSLSDTSPLPKIEPPAPVRRPLWRAVLVNIFIVWHLYCIAAWLWPPSPLKTALQQALVVPTVRAHRDGGWTVGKDSAALQYMHWTGAWQHWEMFAPDPFRENRYLRAEIEFVDGSKCNFVFPRVMEKPVWAKNYYDRWRKMQEQMTISFPGWLPDLARWVARRHAPRDGGPAPKTVRLYLHRYVIPDPPTTAPDDWGAWLRGLPYDAILQQTYEVRPEDLEP